MIPVNVFTVRTATGADLLGQFHPLRILRLGEKSLLTLLLLVKTCLLKRCNGQKLVGSGKKVAVKDIAAPKPRMDGLCLELRGRSEGIVNVLQLGGRLRVRF